MATAVLVLLQAAAIAAPRFDSGVGAVLESLAGEAWSFEGASRRGADTVMEVRWDAAADGQGFVGTALTRQGDTVIRSVSLYAYHPRRGRWTYTSVSTSGVVQEAEELESSDEHFVFKGTAYRPDGSQTTFVWTVSLKGEDSYVSESMAFGDGGWHENPAGTFHRDVG